jgi:uncharacterized Zn finger protein
MIRVNSTLVCPRCQKETTHELHYAGDVLYDIRCTKCGDEFYAGRHTDEDLANELRLRVVSKPRRVLRAVRRKPSTLVGMPVRILTKPARMARELIEALR